MPYDIVIGRDPADKEKFGDKGLIYIGKGYVTMGNYTSLSNKKWMDVARSHVILIAGKRGSGKSYSIGVIAEELAGLPADVAKNIGSLIFDTMGIFWTMKYKNEKDKPLLDEWGLGTKELPVKVFVPFGKVEDYKNRSIPVDETFALKASELEAEDWITTFDLNMTSQAGVLIEKVITDLRERKESFSLVDIQVEIEKENKSSQETKNVAAALFRAADTWGIFSKTGEGTEINKLVSAGKTTVVDLSVYSSIGAFNVRALVISIVSRNLFKNRMDVRKKEELEAIQHGQEYLAYKSTREEPLVWVFIDECLTGDTEIITDKAHTPMLDLINKFEKGEQIKVLAFNQEKNEFSHYPITDIYKKGKRKVINLMTETGKIIKCTPEHRVLTRQGFASAFSVNEIATPIVQHYSEDMECIN